MTTTRCSTRRTPVRLLYRAALFATLLLAHQGAWSPGVQAAATPTPLSCLGPNDLIVDQGQLTLHGSLSYDRVCVQSGASLIADAGLTFRVGALFVAAGGSIMSTGLNGGFPEQTDCRGNGNQSPVGMPGNPLTIIAHQVIVLGRVLSSGGDGIDGSGLARSCGQPLPDDGGPGGAITIKASELLVGGTIAAHGGTGGSGLEAQSPGGTGGAGGTVTVALAQPLPPAQAALLHADGGAGGKGVFQGIMGAPGNVKIRTLTPAELAALPPSPPSYVSTLGTGPNLQQLLPVTALQHSLACNTTDFEVRAGDIVHLAGDRHYEHVCIHAGGTVRVDGALRLRAQTIVVEVGARLTADGTIVPGNHQPKTGRYESAGARQENATPPHAGVPGIDGSKYEYSSSSGAAGGAGGGAITLVAQRVLLAGSVSADGVQGAKGDDGGCSPSGCIGPFSGGGGGSGGGILIVAHELQCSGTISVAGGSGGPSGTNDSGVTDRGAHGGPGYIKIRADLLRVPSGGLQLAGPALISRTLPTDPAIPSTTTPSRYFSDTQHNLSGAFFRYYQSIANPLELFGRPLSEAFPLSGTIRLAQYFERAEMLEDNGQITLMPLGSILTKGLHFAPVSASPAGGQLFPPGYTLSGPFLAFWRSHGGAEILGAPISQPYYGRNGDGSGRTYLLQWTTNGRLEYHPELSGTHYVVTLGLVGVEYLKQQGWL